jgi:hypothetical protein
MRSVDRPKQVCLARRGTVIYLAGRVSELAKEYPELSRADLLAGMQRIKEAIRTSSIPEAPGSITFAVLDRKDGSLIR